MFLYNVMFLILPVIYMNDKIWIDTDKIGLL